MFCLKKFLKSKIKNKGTKEEKKIFNIFLLTGIIEVYLFAWNKNSRFKVTNENVVATAAPIIPNLGTNTKFKVRFVIAAINISHNIIFDFPTIDIKLLDIVNIVEKNTPIESILKVLTADKYSFQKKIFIMVPENNKIKINTGKFIKKIHFPICLLNSSIFEKFLKEYSFAIIGKNNWINNSGAIPNNAAKGMAAL